MEYGFISCLPIIVLIVGALLTKRIMEMLLLATFVGVAILNGTGFLGGFVDVLYETLSSWSLQFVFIILFAFGGLIKLFQTSGAISGFGDASAIIFLMSLLMETTSFHQLYKISFYRIEFSVQGES